MTPQTPRTTDPETLSRRIEMVNLSVEALRTDPLWRHEGDIGRRVLAKRLLFARFCNQARIAEERRCNQQRRGWLR